MFRSTMFGIILVVLVIYAQDSTKKPSREKPSSNRYTRARELQLSRIYRDLRIRRNSTVADVGAGHGWLTVRLARRVGARGKVYAVDIFPQSISYLKEELKRLELKNVEAILGSVADPKLPENTFDAIVILNAYHEFEKPITMLSKLHRAMKSGGRLGIIDRDTDQLRTDARQDYAKQGYIPNRINETLSDNYATINHYIAIDIVIKEVTSMKFQHLFSRELGGDHYIAIFSKL